MRLILVLSMLVVVVLGCGRFGASSGPVSNSSANSNSSAKPVKKLVDLPSLLGKSVDEMNTILGQKQTQKMYSVDYEIENGSVYAQYDNITKKQTVLRFTFREMEIDGRKVRGFVTSKALEQAVGLDLTGTPEMSEYEEVRKDYMINGKKCDVTVKKMLEAYTSISLMCL